MTDTANSASGGTVSEVSERDGDGKREEEAQTITVTLKLYASLGVHLPAHAARNQADVETAAGTTARALLDTYSVPPESCHLVLVNGIYQAPAQRMTQTLKDGDALAVWPPVAGG